MKQLSVSRRLFCHKIYWKLFVFTRTIIDVCQFRYSALINMNKPKLYLQFHEEIDKRSRHFLNNYFSLIRKSNSAKKKVLDIGCGPGNVTHDILYPFFQFEIDEVVGIDISEEMVQHARASYKNEKVSFRVFDISNSNLDEFFEYFDYVFSFWTLQWIKDQQTLYSKIYRLMKPDSDLLLTFIAKCVLTEVFHSVSHKAIYEEHIKDFSNLTLPFQTSKNPAEELKTILQDSGFEVHLCKLTKWRMYTTDDFKNLLISVNSAYDQLPKHLQENFIMDHLEEMKKIGLYTDNDNYVIDYELFVVYARKNKK